MDELKKAAKLLTKKVSEATEKLNIESKLKEADEIELRMNQADYWQVTDNLIAQNEAKKLSDTRDMATPWAELKHSLEELDDFFALDDESMAVEMERKLSELQQQYDSLRSDLRFSAEHDSSDVVMTIQSGAGGIDAQDWAMMLQRMYQRWAEKNDVSVAILSESAGEDAGIKSTSMQLQGKFVFGKLKGEHGVHRLVRRSPFNSANSRETSFAMVEVIPEMESDTDVQIDESDLRVDVYRAGGHGGQSVNTTDSAVQLTHIPTGIVVSIQNERSQIQNKETAMRVLKSRLMMLAEEQHKEKLSDLKGPNQEAAWGNQIRSYVLHPYTMVKDSRSNYSTSDVDRVLGGDLDELINAYIDVTVGDD